MKNKVLEESVIDKLKNMETSSEEQSASLIQKSPWWLISFGAHVLVLIALGLFILAGAKPKEEIRIKVDSNEIVQDPQKPDRPKNNRVEQEKPDEETINIDDLIDLKPSENPGTIKTTEVSIEVENIGAITEGFASPIFENISSNDINIITMALPTGEGGLKSDGLIGPDSGTPARRKNKSRPLTIQGGRDVQNNVKKGLKWLAEHQKSDGSWSVQGGENEASSLYSTGFALLAFLGDGHSTRTGKYQKVVRKGLTWLVAQQQDNGLFQSSGRSHSTMYEHGISTFAVAEAVLMGSSEYTDNAVRGLNFSKNARHEAGGWGYKANDSHSCLSVSGFGLQALHILEEVDHVKRRIDSDFVKDSYDFVFKWGNDETGMSGYHSPGRGSIAMCSVGSILRMYSGRVPTRDDIFLKKAADNIKNSIDQAFPEIGNGNNKRGNSYFMYYGTLVMFQMQGEYWKTWNARMKKYLKHWQEEDGRWPKEMGAHWGDVGQTAIGTMCLEVYYRYKLIYGVKR